MYDEQWHMPLQEVSWSQLDTHGVSMNLPNLDHTWLILPYFWNIMLLSNVLKAILRGFKLHCLITGLTMLIIRRFLLLLPAFCHSQSSHRSLYLYRNQADGYKCFPNPANNFFVAPAKSFLGSQIRVFHGVARRRNKVKIQGYPYSGDKKGPIKTLSQPLKREILPRPGHFKRRPLLPYRFQFSFKKRISTRQD